MRLNIFKPKARPRTHEGARARVITPEQALRRSVLSCMLWEGEFYEDGVEIAGRIHELVPQVEAEKVAALAVEARERMKLRHAPLLLVREMARLATHRGLVAETLARVIQRADELSEFVAIYWARAPAAFGAGEEGPGRCIRQVRRVRAGQVRSRRSGSPARRAFSFARPARGRGAGCAVEAPGRERAGYARHLGGCALGCRTRRRRRRRRDTAKREVWERLLAERKLGALALLRNLRNLQQAGVSEEMVLAALAAMKTDRVLPFRFLAAARSAPQWEEALEAAMFRALDGRAANLAGHTVLLVDVSGSMEAPLSRRSEMRRSDAAYGLAILLREIAEKVTIYTFSDDAKLVPSRRGMALRDALDKSQPHSGNDAGRGSWHRSRANAAPATTGWSSSPTSSRTTGSRAARKGLRDQRGFEPQRRGLRPVDAHRRLERGSGGVHRRARSRRWHAGRLIAFRAHQPSTSATNFGEQPHQGRSPKLSTLLCVIQRPAAWCGTAAPPQCRPRWERPGRATTA